VRFTPEQLEAALADFTANAAVRVVPGAGYNKDITVYGVANEPVQATSGEGPVDAPGGAE
jgi:hypothetical protein